ncbi:Plastid lipid-associated protein chloroplastic-like [Quillaja saponaria]|uniref:Plastid lipid-associated protein chloroplastic-like n=1 Tax=Quillaja saponaria TaxID=32244 RepID=A0AAD7KPY0_QUISA|nr:Plastid lipid-associated protein chloroplastic-like [Quillaja saponaria]
MALLSFTTSTSFIFSKNLKPFSLSSILFPTKTENPSLSFISGSLTNFRHIRFHSLRLNSSVSGGGTPDPVPGDTTIGKDKFSGASSNISDEWGEKYEPEPAESFTKLSDSDPPKDEDEWGGDGVVGGTEDEYVDIGNGSPATTAKNQIEEVDDKLKELKQCLVDTVYGTDLGIRAGAEVRAEVSELVNQLEAVNPTPAPVEAPELLNGNWVLLYTASSELLPLLAAGTTPLLKVEKISQSIDTTSFTIVNSTTLSGPFASFSFSASATYEVRSPTRIQVAFKEGTLQSPEIKSRIELPENVDVFGQKINLSPAQQSLNPLQDVVGSISRAVSGLPPLKLPIPGDRTSSWLIITYLDQDLRISRGDGGLFVLAREGSPFLDQ